jgi:NADPH:quinone reductase-like Zn-dependent oxidoreductase
MAISINPIDWKVLSGAMQQFIPVTFPAILGHDISGVVKEVGDGVTAFKSGDHVIAVGSATYAELVVVPAKNAALIPHALDCGDGAGLPLVTTTGIQLIEEQIMPKSGEKVLITGALGGVGRSAVYAAKLAGATVTAGVRRRKFEEAAELNANHLLALDDERDYGNHGAFDAVADTVGPAVTEKLLPHVRTGGRLVTVTEVPSNAGQFPQVKCSAFHIHPDGKRLAETAIDVVAKKWGLRIPIDRRLPLAQARQGMEAARKGGIGKVLLLP